MGIFKSLAKKLPMFDTDCFSPEKSNTFPDRVVYIPFITETLDDVVVGSANAILLEISPSAICSSAPSPVNKPLLTPSSRVIAFSPNILKPPLNIPVPICFSLTKKLLRLSKLSVSKPLFPNLSASIALDTSLPFASFKLIPNLCADLLIKKSFLETDKLFKSAKSSKFAFLVFRTFPAARGIPFSRTEFHPFSAFDIIAA